MKSPYLEIRAPPENKAYTAYDFKFLDDPAKPNHPTLAVDEVLDVTTEDFSHLDPTSASLAALSKRKRDEMYNQSLQVEKENEKRLQIKTQLEEIDHELSIKQELLRQKEIQQTRIDKLGARVLPDVGGLYFSYYDRLMQFARRFLTEFYGKLKAKRLKDRSYRLKSYSESNIHELMPNICQFRRELSSLLIALRSATLRILEYYHMYGDNLLEGSMILPQATNDQVVISLDQPYFQDINQDYVNDPEEVQRRHKKAQQARKKLEETGGTEGSLDLLELEAEKEPEPPKPKFIDSLSSSLILSSAEQMVHVAQNTQPLSLNGEFANTNLSTIIETELTNTSYEDSSALLTPSSPFKSFTFDLESSFKYDSTPTKHSPETNNSQLDATGAKRVYTLTNLVKNLPHSLSFLDYYPFPCLTPSMFFSNNPLMTNVDLNNKVTVRFHTLREPNEDILLSSTSGSLPPSSLDKSLPGFSVSSKLEELASTGANVFTPEFSEDFYTDYFDYHEESDDDYEQKQRDSNLKQIHESKLSFFEVLELARIQDRKELFKQIMQTENKSRKSSSQSNSVSVKDNIVSTSETSTIASQEEDIAYFDPEQQRQYDVRLASASILPFSADYTTEVTSSPPQDISPRKTNSHEEPVEPVYMPRKRSTLVPRRRGSSFLCESIKEEDEEDDLSISDDEDDFLFNRPEDNSDSDEERYQLQIDNEIEQNDENISLNSYSISKFHSNESKSTRDRSKDRHSDKEKKKHKKRLKGQQTPNESRPTTPAHSKDNDYDSRCKTCLKLYILRLKAIMKAQKNNQYKDSQILYIKNKIKLKNKVLTFLKSQSSEHHEKLHFFNTYLGNLINGNLISYIRDKEKHLIKNTYLQDDIEELVAKKIDMLIKQNEFNSKEKKLRDLEIQMKYILERERIDMAKEDFESKVVNFFHGKIVKRKFALWNKYYYEVGLTKRVEHIKKKYQLKNVLKSIFLACQNIWREEKNIRVLKLKMLKGIFVQWRKRFIWIQKFKTLRKKCLQSIMKDRLIQWHRIIEINEQEIMRIKSMPLKYSVMDHIGIFSHKTKNHVKEMNSKIIANSIKLKKSIQKKIAELPPLPALPTIPALPTLSTMPKLSQFSVKLPQINVKSLLFQNQVAFINEAQLSNLQTEGEAPENSEPQPVQSELDSPDGLPLFQAQDLQGNSS